jgi:hypothetical protein
MQTVPSGLRGELHSISESLKAGVTPPKNQAQREAKWFFAEPQMRRHVVMPLRLSAD